MLDRLQERAAEAVRRSSDWFRRAVVTPMGNLVGWRRVAGFSVAGIAALIATLAVLLTVMDWNALRGPAASFASATLGRRVAIGGDLDVDVWAGRLRVQDLVVSGPDWAPDCNTMAIADGRAHLRLLPLLTGRWVFDEIELIQPRFCLRREESGRASWQFRGGDGANYPAIRRFRIRDGRLMLDDRRRGLVFDGAVHAVDAGESATPFELGGAGEMNGEPFRAVITGPALRAISRSRPYVFRADIVAGATRLRAAGAIDRPFDLNAFSAHLVGSGPDLARLYPLTGVTLPNTPPYDLRGYLRRDGKVFRLTQLQGTIGDSDIVGALTVDRRRPRMLLRADIASRSLDFDDLAVVLGGAPDTGAGESASADQRAEAQLLRAAGRLLPDARLDLKRVRRMDARV
jgi:hypothetical protein